MEKCLIVINKNAGKCRDCTFKRVEKALGKAFDYDIVYLSKDVNVNYSGYRNVAVCGGDGTLSSVLSEIYSTRRTIYYFPCGTLNDKAKAKRYAISPKPTVVGRANDGIFTYVLAAGAFTPIGYLAKVKNKKRLGILAYVFKILEAYKVNRIKAEVTSDGAEICKGEFNLLMFLKSPRCFGFNFNRAYDEDSESAHLIAIRSPRHDGILGKIEMFFPFFRVFFLGLKTEQNGNVIFKRIENAELKLHSLTSFCVDGEQVFYKDNMNITFEKTDCRLKIVNNYRN